MATPGEKKRIKASDINAALRRRWGGGVESCIMFEVAQGTGQHARRHLDAIAMELWPSRGLALHGIEVKVDLYDFRREAKDPGKAEEIARFCDYFWIAAPKDLVPVIELPSAWGLLELDGTKLSIKKTAVKTPAQPLTPLFVAALLRASCRPVTESDVAEVLKARMQVQQEEFDKKVSERAKQMVERANEDAGCWRRLKEVLGLKEDEYVYSDDVITGLKFLIKSDFIKNWNGVRNLHDDMIKFVTKFGSALNAIGMPSKEDLATLEKGVKHAKR